MATLKRLSNRWCWRGRRGPTGIALLALVLAALSACGSDDSCTPGAKVACDCPGQDLEVTCGGDGVAPPCLCAGGGGGGQSGAFDWSKDTTVVVDSVTGLMWQRVPAPQKFVWQAANDACGALVLAGHEDWLLPHKDELLTIVRKTTTAPAIDTVAFPDTPSAPFWTRTLYGPFSDTSAWGVDFEDGGEGYALFTEPHHARCVRLVQ